MTPSPYNFQKSEKDNEQGAVFLGDTMARLGRVETQLLSILPTLGRVEESLKGLDQGVREIKDHVKVVGVEVNEVKIVTIGYGKRISDLEGDQKDIQDFKESERGKVLENAQTIINEQNKDKKDRRNKVLALIGTATASIVTGVILTWLRLRL